MSRAPEPMVVPCVGGIVRDGDGRLLMIRRAREPSRGRWSLPGGKVEPGESDAQAVVREVREETGLDVEVLGPAVGRVELAMPDGSIAAVADYLCRPLAGTDAGTVRGGDDADDAAWFEDEELRELDCSPGLVANLDRWGVLSAGSR